MDFEKQIREMISDFTQQQQYLWGAWESMMQGWIDTFYRSAEAWGKIQLPDVKVSAPLGLRQLDGLGAENQPTSNTKEIAGTAA